MRAMEEGEQVRQKMGGATLLNYVNSVSTPRGKVGTLEGRHVPFANT